jgi:pyruvate carboxylase
MRPLAEVVLSRKDIIFQPAISLTYAKGFDITHYLDVTDSIVQMTASIMGIGKKEASRHIILGLKDMAGICPPRFMTEFVKALRKRWPELVLHYHRHYTDGLFVPACGAAAKAGTHILDVGLGAAVRSYGQGDALATMAYLEDELGLRCSLDRDAIRDANFVCKQIMPYYDRYCAPYFQGIDYDVTLHGMPGGATSSSQEGAMKQGYIHLLPYMLKFLEGTRRIVRYHDVTPGSQITWNTAFLAVTGAWKRGGEEEVRFLLEVLNEVTRTPSDELSPEMLKARLSIYQDCNDAFRNLLLGKFGKLPLGFPEDWVYRSAFGADWKKAIVGRTEISPLEMLPDIDLAVEEKVCTDILKRKPSEEEFVLYLNHPADALKTMQFKEQFGDPNNLPLHVWFEGLKIGQDLYFNESKGKPHHLVLLSISRPSDMGVSVCRYVLDSEIMSCEVKVAQPVGKTGKDMLMADPANQYHIAAPSNGDLWIMYVHPGDIVNAGEELFNVSIMKQEKAVLAPVDGIVRRVLKTADFKESKQMVSVREGELIVELGPVPRLCGNTACGQPVGLDNAVFCPHCGTRLE